MRICSNRMAFTLSEVLITLLIIGVVAAITLPSLIARTQKLQTITQLKRSYSMLGQALKLSEADNGEIGSWDLYSPSAFKTYILPYLKLASYCENCNVNYEVKQINNIKAVAASTFLYHQGSYKNIIVYLADGTIIATTQSDRNNFHADGKEKFPTPIIPITVDINGTRAPNKYGKDIFLMELNSKHGLRQYGYGAGNWNRYRGYGALQGGHKHSCNKNATFGYWCFAKIITDGWQIKNDYPW